MPTSLNYINQLIRGFEPWRPDAVTGTVTYEVQGSTLEISWMADKTQTPARAVTFRGLIHFIALNISMGATLLNSDGNAALASVPCLEKTVVANAPYVLTRKIETDSLLSYTVHTDILSAYTVPLGPPHPRPNDVNAETFSTSIFKHSNGIVATTTEIYTKRHSRPTHAGPSACRSRLPTSYTGGTLCKNFNFGRTLKHHPFSELIHSAGELLHTPWRISTSMTTVLLSK